jgi:type I restriction enzyme S subunit
VSIGLPIGWCCVPLDELIEGIDAGKNIRCEERPPLPHERGVVKISAVTWGRFDPLASKTAPSDATLPERQKIKTGDFLISRANTLDLVGATVIVDEAPENLYLSDKVLRIRTVPEQARWLNWYLKSEAGRREIESRASGNQLSMRNIGQAEIRSIPVPVAPQAEQNRILSQIEALFARTRQARAELARIHSLCGHLNKAMLTKAASGDLTSEWRETTGSRSDAIHALAAIRAARASDRKLSGRKKTTDKSEPALPDSWAWISPDELASDQDYSIGIGPFGSNLVQGDYRSHGVRLVFVRDIRRRDFSAATAKYVTRDKADQLAPHAVFGGEVLITKMGDPPGDTALYPEAAGQAVITADCIKLLPHPELADSRYLVEVLRAPLVAEQISQITKGVAQQKVSLQDFRQIAVPVPPLDEQAEIISRLDRMNVMAGVLLHDASRVLALLDHLERTILTRAFQGELLPQDPAEEPAAKTLARLAATQPLTARLRRGQRAIA